MDTMKDPQQGCNADEYLLQQTLHFGESLKELRSIGAQMYAAAEHFEQSYYKNNDHQQQLVEVEVEESLKDYITEALINTVDHLGCVAYKVNRLLEDKVNEISSATLQFSGIEQRLKTHQQFINLIGLSSQSLVSDTPKHYKRYTISGLNGHDKSKLKSICSDYPLYPYPQDDSQMHRHHQGTRITGAFQVPRYKCNAPSPRKGHYRPCSAEVSPKPQSFFSMRAASVKEIGKRAVSPLKFPIQRCVSVATRPTSPSASNIKQQHPSEPRSKGKGITVYPRKSKHLFKTLLSLNLLRKLSVPKRLTDEK